MPNININVTDKRALLEGSPVIICGNSDYTVTFTFDEEWSLTGVRTARFVYVKDGKVEHEDKPFQGDTVDVPVLSDVAFVKVGVYAGELCTTTPARINCEASILCGSGTVTAPEPDVYSQIMALFEDMAQQGAFGATEAQAQQIEQNRRDIEKVEAIAKGRNQARVFKTPADMQAWLRDANNQGVANVGDNLYIEALEVPDWWVAKVLTAPNTSGYYYEVAQLEVQKVDLNPIEEDIENLEDRATNLEEEVAEVKAKRDTAVTTDRKLPGGFAGGLRVLEIDGVSEQGEAPTLEAPQGIKSVQGRDGLEIKTHGGRNLFDPEGRNYVTGVTVNKNTMTFSQASFTSDTRTYYLPCEPGTLYSYTKALGANVRLFSCPEVPAVGDTLSVIKEKEGTTVSITTGPADNYICIYPLWSNELGNLTWEEVLPTIQVEEGPATEFTPHLSSAVTIPLAEPLREHDKIAKQGGLFGVLRGTESRVFNGSEAWVASGALVGRYGVVLNAKASSPCLCTIASNGLNGSTAPNECFINQNGDFYINTGFATVEEWTASLAEQPMTVEYELAEPIFEPFPAEVQKALNSLKTYEGTTRITTDSEVEPIIEAEHGITQAGAMALENSCGLEVLRCEFEQMRAGLGDQVRFTSDGITLNIESV